MSIDFYMLSLYGRGYVWVYVATLKSLAEGMASPDAKLPALLKGARTCEEFMMADTCGGIASK
jgi:hypothetical protein